ncbi:hypothetical protein KQ940_09385 [Marinobacterium sp. D7]|nr:hypothetical protein [Marinobacterium ramblicola]
MFASAYSTCFIGAMKFVAGQDKIQLPLFQRHLRQHPRRAGAEVRLQAPHTQGTVCYADMSVASVFNAFTSTDVSIRPSPCCCISS